MGYWILMCLCGWTIFLIVILSFAEAAARGDRQIGINEDE